MSRQSRCAALRTATTTTSPTTTSTTTTSTTTTLTTTTSPTTTITKIGFGRYRPALARLQHAAKGMRMSKLLTGALAGSAGGTLLLDEARTSTHGSSTLFVPGEIIVADDPLAATLRGEYVSITGPSVVSGNSTHAQNLPGSTVFGAAGNLNTEASIASIRVTRTLITGVASTSAVTPGTATLSVSPVVHPATITLSKSLAVGSRTAPSTVRRTSLTCRSPPPRISHDCTCVCYPKAGTRAIGPRHDSRLQPRNSHRRYR